MRDYDQYSGRGFRIRVDRQPSRPTHFAREGLTEGPSGFHFTVMPSMIGRTGVSVPRRYAALAEDLPSVPASFCPICQRSVRVLRVLDGRAGCQQCLKLDYASRHQDRADPFRVAVRLRRRLGAHPSLLEPLPPRPRDGRAAREYDRLASAIAVAEARALAWLRAFNSVLEKRYGRRRRRRAGPRSAI